MVDYEGTLLVPSRTFIMKGALLKSSRKTLTARFFFLVGHLVRIGGGARGAAFMMMVFKKFHIKVYVTCHIVLIF